MCLPKFELHCNHLSYILKNYHSDVCRQTNFYILKFPKNTQICAKR